LRGHIQLPDVDLPQGNGITMSAKTRKLSQNHPVVGEAHRRGDVPVRR
jgi:hypothetical protein